MRILAFDPSLRNLGVAVGDIVEHKLEMEYVETYYIDKMVDRYGQTPDWDIDPNTRRVELLRYIGERLLTNYQPDVVVIELPIFNGVNPNSLQVQMKAIVTLETLVIQFSDRIRYNIVEYVPNVIKAGVGVKTQRGVKTGKTDITNALLNLVDKGNLVYREEKYDPNHADEHANDAASMCYTKYLELEEEFLT